MRAIISRNKRAHTRAAAQVHFTATAYNLKRGLNILSA
jgi:hypothetical protein